MERTAPTGFRSSIAARFHESLQTGPSRVAENPNRGVPVFAGSVGKGRDASLPPEK
jgi:hypothetical protein